uniref:GST C-terminal domain-containing protein n=1 Tax=Caenorhabditis japonica TaxID=281687 RepID=A0A8R1HN32_CAEJA
MARKVALLTSLPRTITVPYYAPSCLFLETVLRSKSIPYQTIQCSLYNVLPREHLFPLIEADGYCFRNVMEGLDYLLAIYGKSIDSGLSPLERAQAVALSALLDELTWMLAFSRGHDFTWLRDDRKIIEDFSKIRLYFWRNWIVPQMQKRTRRRVRGYGLSGKSAGKEVTVRTEAMLEALASILNSNKYFFNVNEPSWLDCKAFAVLAQFKYTPLHNEARVKQFMRDRTPNLMTFVTRMKEDFWADWSTNSD